MSQPKKYRRAIVDLHLSLLQAGAVVVQLPPTPTADMQQAGGMTPTNHALKTAADSIDGVLVAFDRLQQTLGLPAGYEGRFAAFLAGKCREGD